MSFLILSFFKRSVNLLTSAWGILSKHFAVPAATDGREPSPPHQPPPGWTAARGPATPLKAHGASDASVGVGDAEAGRRVTAHAGRTGPAGSQDRPSWFPGFS